MLPLPNIKNTYNEMITMDLDILDYKIWQAKKYIRLKKSLQFLRSRDLVNKHEADENDEDECKVKFKN